MRCFPDCTRTGRGLRCPLAVGAEECRRDEAEQRAGVPAWMPWLLCAVALVALIVLLLMPIRPARAAEVQTRTSVVQIPQASWQYRRAVEQASEEYFGLAASPARLAAKLHQESGWNADAQSPYAQGLAQFVPATARWLPEVCPEIGPFDPWDAYQSIRAASCYDRWHYKRVRAADECNRWAFTMSAYNGGLGWLNRDTRLASASGADPLVWFDSVEGHSARAGWAFRENRHYVRRILLDLEPAYIAAGWSGVAVCP